MTTPNEKNLASGTIAENISASSTTILVYVGEGGATTIRGVWPTAPFYATIMPSNPNAGVANSLDSEIVLVTAVSNDQVGNTALTVTRGQRGTTTKAYVEGDIVTAGIYAEDAVLLGDDGVTENPSPWVTQDDIVMGSLNFGNYSTNETNTGFTWVDGKKIYKKTINTGALPNNTTKTVAHGISNLDKIISLSGIAVSYRDTGDAFITLPFVDTADVYLVGAWVNGGNILIRSGSDRSNYTESYITLYYTKTIG